MPESELINKYEPNGALKREIVQRLAIVRNLASRGLMPSEIKVELETKHGIEVSLDTVSRDINDLERGVLNHSWLDSLLDIYYPEIYQETLKAIDEAGSVLKEIMQAGGANNKVRVSAAKAYASVNIDKINALHKGPVVRELKKVSIRGKKLARQVLEEKKHNEKLEDQITKSKSNSN